MPTSEFFRMRIEPYTEAEAVAAVEKWLKVSKAYADDIRNA